jgi:hypothetical protein
VLYSFEVVRRSKIKGTKPILNKYPKSLFVIFCFTLALGIGAVRYLTGPELALSLFYLFPIGLATWYGGMWIGVFMSLISALSWLAADAQMYLAKQNGKNRTRYKVITNDEGLVRSIVNL